MIRNYQLKIQGNSWRNYLIKIDREYNMVYYSIYRDFDYEFELLRKSSFETRLEDVEIITKIYKIFEELVDID